MALCYWYRSTGASLHKPGVPCTSTANGAVAMCCDEGQTCLSDGICGFPTQDPGGSGYYLGGCTDPSFKDPACPTNCTSFINTDVVYNFSDEYWQCCGSRDGARNCSLPAGDPLSGGAPPPINLTYIAKIQSSTFVPLQPSVMPVDAAVNGASPTGATESSPSASTTNATGGLSAGAGIGIGLVIGLVLAALIWLLAWRIWRYRGYRLVNAAQNSSQNETFSGLAQEIGPTHTSHRSPVAEIPDHYKPEIYGTDKVEIQDTSRSHERAEVPA